MQSQTVSENTNSMNVLAERAKNGDREAFVAITRQYQKSVFQLSYSFFQNREDALDIVQETFLKIYQKIHYYEAGRSFKNWILQVAKNLCIEKKKKNHKKHDQKALGGDEIEEIHLTDEKGTERNSDTDIKIIMAKCLKQLPERQRMIFVMKHYNELKYKDIAETLGIAVGTVKSLNFKAVNKLRNLINPYLGRQ